MPQRTAAAAALAALVAGLAGCSSESVPSPPGAGAPGSGLVVVTAGGTALEDGALDVPPTLDLRVATGQALDRGDVTATLDRRTLDLRIDGDAATASVAAMPLASAHTLDLAVRGRDPRRLRFHVVAPVAARAALHRDPAAGVVLDLAVALAPDHAAVEAAVPGGDRTWVDERHLRVIWPGPPGGSLRIPGGIATARGSHLAGDLVLDLTAPAAGTLRAAEVPAAPAPAPGLVAGFSVPTPASHASVIAHRDQLSVLAPTGMVAGPDGSVTGAPDAVAVGAGLPLLPLVQNRGFDPGVVTALLGDPAARERLVAGLRSRAGAGGWLGVQLDFENVPESERRDLSALAAALASALHADGRRLWVDVVPHRAGHINPANAGYDLHALAGVADELVLMAYEEHGPSSAPGPVAGLGWDRELLAGSLGEIGDPARAILGVPLYARAWADPGAGSSADAYGAAVGAALAVPGARVDYDFAAATPFILTPDGSTYFDDARSLARKLALVPEHRLAGVAMWRLGFEDPALWAELPSPAPRP